MSATKEIFFLYIIFNLFIDIFFIRKNEGGDSNPGFSCGKNAGMPLTHKAFGIKNRKYLTGTAKCV